MSMSNKYPPITSTSVNPSTSSTEPLYLLHHPDSDLRGRPPMPPASLFVEASVAMPSAPRYRQEQPRGRSVTGHRLCRTRSRNRTTAPVQGRRSLPWGRASLPSGKKLRHRTFHRDETGHHLLPPSTPQQLAAGPKRCSRH